MAARLYFGMNYRGDAEMTIKAETSSRGGALGPFSAAGTRSNTRIPQFLLEFNTRCGGRYRRWSVPNACSASVSPSAASVHGLFIFPKASGEFRVLCPSLPLKGYSTSGGANRANRSRIARERLGYSLCGGQMFNERAPGVPDGPTTTAECRGRHYNMPKRVGDGGVCR